MSALTLHYFNGRGLGEIPRLTLVLADVKFEDKRYEIAFDAAGPVHSKEFLELKASDKLPFGQVPILEVKDGDKTTTLAQCHAIARYIARDNGLFGRTNLEGALIDAITEHVRDGTVAYMKAKGSAEDKAKYFAEYLPTHFTRLNRFIEAHSTDKSTCVGSTASLADIYVLYFCSFFDDQESVEKALASCHHVVAVRDAISNNPRIKNWIETRPQTAF